MLVSLLKLLNKSISFHDLTNIYIFNLPFTCRPLLQVRLGLAHVWTSTIFKMAKGKPKYQIAPGMKLFWCGLISSVAAFFFMFLAFCSPYWYQSWRRVHSPLANVGLWHICLSGYVKPRDPSLQSYVGCWWIHSTFFKDVDDFIMPRKWDWFLFNSWCLITLNVHFQYTCIKPGNDVCILWVFM